MTTNDTEAVPVRERVQSMERLLGAIETLPDPIARGRASEAVEALVDLYGDALARIMAAVGASTDAAGLAGTLADDDLVCHLLLIHDLHPVSAEERIERALETLRPTLAGAAVEFAGVDAGVARIRFSGDASGACGSMSPEHLIETTVWDAAPELDGVAIDRRPEPVPVTLRVSRQVGTTVPPVPS